MPNSPSGSSAPLLSLLVPTCERPDLVAQLLGHLDRQTLEASRFELILVDDGSAQPLEVDAAAHDFAVTVLRQANAGPAAARNLGLEHCRAPLTLILNDDAVPAPDLCDKHLEAHAAATGKVAILGTFKFTERALASPFTQLLASTDLLFAFPHLIHGGLHNWTFFWTCNISIATQALRDVGGFDAQHFDRPIVEDVELGYRLQAQGYQVLHRADLICEHDHALSAADYFSRAVNLGIYLARMYTKHEDQTILWCAPGQEVNLTHLPMAQSTCEAMHAPTRTLLTKLGAFEREYQGQRVPEELLSQLTGLVRRLSFTPFCQGLLRELEGHDPMTVIEQGPPRGTLTSLIVVAHDALDQTRRCLEALRASAERDHPVEYLFIDNGSSDGTAEYLAQQDDVELIRNDTNLGAPRARNQGLARARGEHLVFMDNDVLVTPGWLGRMLYHSAVDGQSGCVGCVCDRAGQEQQVPYDGDSSPATLRAFADRRASEFPRQHRYQGLMSSFLLMTRRAVIDAIGGFDESFTPWGFEDDDFTLRVQLAGFRNRVALDVFVRHEAYAGAAKSTTHTGLLERNWKRFANKWGLPAGTPYGKYDGLDALDHGQWEASELHLPLEDQDRAGESILAWPDYRNTAAVRSLLGDVADELVDDDSRHLMLRVDAQLDGPVEEVLKVIEAAYADVLSPQQMLNVAILDDASAGEAAVRAVQLCSSINTVGSIKRRTKWLNRTGLPHPTESSA